MIVVLIPDYQTTDQRGPLIHDSRLLWSCNETIQVLLLYKCRKLMLQCAIIYACSLV